MNSRFLLGGVLSVVCLVALWKVFAQRQELSSLRGDQERLRAQTASSPDGPTAAATDSTPEARTNPPAASPVLLELLRLRSEVTMLMGRQRELSGVRAENERLRGQVVTMTTNVLSTNALPPGYILRSQAQWAGFNTPENTMQSILWALQNHDFTNFLAALTPANAQELLTRVQQTGNSVDAFFQDAAALPGMRVLQREPQPDGAIVLRLELMPGQPNQPVRFEQIGGQWKMATH